MMNICGPVCANYVDGPVNYGNNLHKQIVNILPNICIEIRNTVLLMLLHVCMQSIEFKQ